jgi:hypothetical protein
MIDDLKGCFKKFLRILLGENIGKRCKITRIPRFWMREGRKGWLKTAKLVGGREFVENN